jgi:hypothetical protein
MPLLFTAADNSGMTGRVFSVEENAAAGAIAMARVGSKDGGGGITYDTHRTIITRVGISMAGNFQTAHMLDNDVYVYVFGDRMGQAIIHGISFSQSCGTNQQGETGFELLYKWYLDNRVAQKKSLCSITIGTKQNFRGFVIKLDADAQDAVHRTVHYQLTLALLPFARK